MTPEVEALYEILKVQFPDMADSDLVELAEGIDAGVHTLEDVLFGGDAAPASSEVPWTDPAYVVPSDFFQAITRDNEWFDRMMDWGLDQDEQDLLMRYMHYRFVNGYGPDENNPTNWYPGQSIEDFMGGDEGQEAANRSDWAIYDEVQGWFDSDMFLPPGSVGSEYTPSAGSLPEGWLTFWGEDYVGPQGKPLIKNWLDTWVERFNKNAEATGGPGDPKYDEADLIHDFYNHAVDGLYAQGWWAEKTNNFLAMTEMWYTQGGPGSVAGGDFALPGAQGADWSAYSGVGNWGKIWSDTIEVIRSTAEDLGIEDELGSDLVNQIAFRLMAEGGAAAHLEPQTAEGWPNQARQKIENILIEELQTGGFAGELGVGTISDIEKRLRAYADMQMIDLDALAVMNDTTVRDWALGIKSETGLNESQIQSTIANQAYTQWGLTPDEISGMGQAGAEGSSTITNFVAPLWKAATDFWDDSSYRKDDPWLMDNYQVANEDGTKRFRTAAEMRNLARTNLDRSQHSSEYQDPMNEVLARAAAMFRSDY